MIVSVGVQKVKSVQTQERGPPTWAQVDLCRGCGLLFVVQSAHNLLSPVCCIS